MAIDIIKALVFAGVPVAFFSYYLVVFTGNKISIKANNAKEFKQELKHVDHEQTNQDGFLKRVLLKKIMRFGGGFYGVMALLTYIHIEFYQIVNFVKNFKNLQHFIESIGFKMLINFFIEAILNLVNAFMWPIYWQKFLPVGSLWVWVVVAFLAYSFSTKHALKTMQNLPKEQ